MILASGIHEGERKRTAIEVSKRNKTMSKSGRCSGPEISMVESLCPDHTASGIEAARACIGL